MLLLSRFDRSNEHWFFQQVISRLCIIVFYPFVIYVNAVWVFTCKGSTHLWIESAEARPHPSPRLIKHLKRKIKIHGKWEAWVGWARGPPVVQVGVVAALVPGFYSSNFHYHSAPAPRSSEHMGRAAWLGFARILLCWGQCTALILLSSLLLKFHLSRPDPL